MTDEVRVYCRTVDERTGRVVEDMVKTIPGRHSPAVALSFWIHDEQPPFGTYTAETVINGKLKRATLHHEPAKGRRAA